VVENKVVAGAGFEPATSGLEGLPPYFPKDVSAQKVRNNFSARQLYFWLDQFLSIALKNLDSGGIYYKQLITEALASETSLTIRLLFHLPIRQAEGFLKSLLKLMELYLPVQIAPLYPAGIER
jgi:hypothetical protein